MKKHQKSNQQAKSRSTGWVSGLTGAKLTRMYNQDEQGQEVTCVERGCGNVFVITDRHARYFTDRGLCLPKRCGDCRGKRRVQNEATKDAASE